MPSASARCLAPRGCSVDGVGLLGIGVANKTGLVVSPGKSLEFTFFQEYAPANPARSQFAVENQAIECPNAYAQSTCGVSPASQYGQFHFITSPATSRNEYQVERVPINRVNDEEIFSERKTGRDFLAPKRKTACSV